MTIQTTYGYIKPAVAGQLVDMYTNEIVSKKVSDAAGLLFGIAVDRDGDLGVAAGSAGFGISVRELTREADVRGTGAITKYNQYNSAAILRKGHVYVELGTAAGGVAAGDVVAALTADGTIVKTGTALAVDITGATFESAAVTGDVVEIRLA